MDAMTKRITELESTVERLERKLATCEIAIQAMLERRKRLLPAEFDSPEIEELFRTQCANAVEGWRLSAAQNDTAQREANRLVLFERARAQATQRMADADAEADAKLAAEVLTAIQFYEETGHAPTGYTIIDGPATQ